MSGQVYGMPRRRNGGRRNAAARRKRHRRRLHLGGVTLWSSGTYKSHGAGNVVKTGNGYFLYDRVSRLIEGRIYDGPTGGGTQKWQTYTYDPFGNIQTGFKIAEQYARAAFIMPVPRSLHCSTKKVGS